MIRLLPWLLTIALLVYALVDCVQCDDSRIRYVPKVMWVLAIVFFPLVGSLAWLLAGRSGGGQRRRGPSHPPAPPRGPDDDPDFLRRL